MVAANSRIAVFARAPEPGKVKTRLIPALGAAAAAELQRRLSLHALETAIASGIGPVELWCAPDADHPFFIDCSRRFAVALFPQGRGDLGERMSRALEAMLGTGERAILIGSDIPSLTPQYLCDADAALEEGCDAVLGPAEDGGYVLIGLRRAAPALFDNMPWGSPAVCAQTRARLENMRLRYRELPSLWDLDRPEDLARLDESLRVALTNSAR
jgi:uncharacterized protein